MKEKLMKDINEKRRKLGKPLEPALLILDGHSTRLQYELWDELSEANVDVLVIPSHTSNMLQPLDLCVNARFKQCLLNNKSFPNKTEMKNKLIPFIRSVTDNIHEALSPEAIRKGFYEAHILNKENDFEKLKVSINEFIEAFPMTCLPHLKVYL